MKDGVSYLLTDLILIVFIWVVRVIRTTPTAIVTVGVAAATATALVVIATTICLLVSATATAISCSCIGHHMVLLPLYLLRHNSRFSVKKPGVDGLWADRFRHLIDLLNQRIVISIKTIENI
jgi:hypothetical protein